MSQKKRKNNEEILNSNFGHNAAWLISYLKSQKIQYPPLTPKQERKMLEENRGNEDEIQRLLFMHNIHLVFTGCKPYSRSTRDYDEMVARGLEGLAEATKKFDIDRGTKFSTYAVPWIRKGIRKEFNTKEIKKKVKLVSMNQPVKPFETNVSTDFEDLLSADDFQPDWTNPISQTPLENLYDSEANEIQNKIYDFVKTSPKFSTDERDIFFRLFSIGQKIKDISSETGLSAFQINKRKRKAIKSIKSMLKEEYGLSGEEMQELFLEKVS